MTSHPSNETLANLEKELAIYYAALSILVDECFMPEAGYRMLGVSADDVQGGGVAKAIDVRSTRIGKLLPVWTRYAYEGVLSAGYESSDFNTTDGPLERLREMLMLLRADDGYFEDCLSSAQCFGAHVPLGGLEDLVRRVEARDSLDAGNPMTTEELAVLASMSERSVRNALSADGEGSLQLGAHGRIAHQDAFRWLQGRRGFLATQKRYLPTNLSELPDSLDHVEIPPFIRQRLTQLWAPVADAEYERQMVNNMGHAGWVGAASRACGLPMERIEAAIRLPLDIRPGDCERLAKALQVDRVWLTHQVMAALFPDQVDMLLNPEAWKSDDDMGKAEEPTTSVTVTLTDKMLAHGYIDLPMSVKAMFPDDCFGSRTEGDEGRQVELVYGTHHAQSDIRIKSAKTISPRRRFTAWLNTELGARPGDRIRIARSGDRQFTLTHLAN